MATATSPLLSLSSLSASLPSPARAPASLSLHAIAPQARLSTSYTAFPIGTALLFSPLEFNQENFCLFAAD
jgi:small subunit ribosomal protein S20